MPRAPRTTVTPSPKLQLIIPYDGFLLALDNQNNTWRGIFEPHSAINDLGVDTEKPFSLEWYMIPQSFFTYNNPPQQTSS